MTTTATAFAPTPQQDKALQQVAAWFHTGSADKPFFYLAGYAGTGKTTLARHLAEGIDGTVLYAAYTGKAALQLQKSGCQGASTVHSLTYRLEGTDQEALNDLSKRLRETNSMDEKRLLIQKINELGKPSFILDQDSQVKDAALLVLDECSMIDEDMARDLLSFGTKILVLGDPGQLPPVKGEGYFTQKPDFMLTDIRRQALDNPIIALSMRVRENGTIPKNFAENCGSGNSLLLTNDRLVAYDQILCGKHKTRLFRNKQLRRVLGFDEKGRFPVEGDKLIVLRNDRKHGIFNGLMARATSDCDQREATNFEIGFDFETELGANFYDAPVFSGYFEEYDSPGIVKNIPFWAQKDKFQMDYSYTITVHKAQGSQWDNVLLIDDNMFVWDRDARIKWLYTAVTRAVDSFWVVRG